MYIRGRYFRYFVDYRYWKICIDECLHSLHFLVGLRGCGNDQILVYLWAVFVNLCLKLITLGFFLIERVILDANLGGHEAVIGDVDQDGDLDICSKLWRARPQNANGGKNHFDYLENLLVP